MYFSVNTSTFTAPQTTDSWLENSALPTISYGTMASADYFNPLRSKSSHGKILFLPINPPDLHYGVTIDFGASQSIARLPTHYALYQISVRRIHLLPRASFRSCLTAGTLALSYSSLSTTPVWDLHLEEQHHAWHTKNAGRHRRHFQFNITHR